MAVKCPNCGVENPESKKFCSDCGNALESQIRAEAKSTSSPTKSLRSKWLVPAVAVLIVMIVLAATLFVYYSPDYSWDASIRDHDGDGHADEIDSFPYDPAE
jgi:uncharacterized membrane protein YvbJ